MPFRPPRQEARSLLDAPKNGWGRARGWRLQPCQVLRDAWQALLEELDEEVIHLVGRLLLDRVPGVPHREERRARKLGRHRAAGRDRDPAVLLSPQHERRHRDRAEAAPAPPIECPTSAASLTRSESISVTSR